MVERNDSASSAACDKKHKRDECRNAAEQDRHERRSPLWLNPV